MTYVSSSLTMCLTGCLTVYFVHSAKLPESVHATLPFFCYSCFCIHRSRYFLQALGEPPAPRRLMRKVRKEACSVHARMLQRAWQMLILISQ